MKNFFRVYSGINNNGKNATKEFLESIINTKDYELTELETPRASEMGKLLENSYRSMNIAFAIEWSRFAEANSVNLYEVVDAIRKRPTHANLMYPGIGVGGYCLTKDGLIADASFEGGDLSMTVNAVRETDRMPIYALNFVINQFPDLNVLKTANCIVAGVAYAPGVGDTRFSPVETFVTQLSQKAKKLYCVDPYVSFWEELDLTVHPNCEHLPMEKITNIFICTKHEELFMMMNSLPTKLKKHINLFDLVGLFQRSDGQSKTQMFGNYFLLGAK